MQFEYTDRHLRVRNDNTLTKSLALEAVLNSERAEAVTLAPAMAA